MDTFESQFYAIVGSNYTPSQELDAEQFRALTALIFGMPTVEVIRKGDLFEYEGWSPDQKIYVAVTVTSDHTFGAQALCAPLGQFDR
ncbi:hypothetical protein ACLE20_08855 [Rhizobium sp. YIM 134829]|uniref:hypothetical protein n=1 Tax=Rhizobium sp. YIM 134829 TaxID=3390453 RepID=UPI00397D40F9